MAEAGSFTGFPTNAYPQPFPLQQSNGVKMYCFKSTVYNLQKAYNIQVLRKYINFWYHSYKWIITQAVARPENGSNGAIVKCGL